MKPLEALKRIRQETCPATILPDFDKEECCKIIEDSLQALEIINKKEVNVCQFKGILDYSANVALELYNNGRHKKFKLTIDEFKLLKRVLK